MPHVVDWRDVTTSGLETSPVAPALAGLRANEARYLHDTYAATSATESGASAEPLISDVARVLLEERGIVIASPALEAAELEVDGIRWTHVFHESGWPSTCSTRGRPTASARSGSRSPRAWTRSRSSLPSRAPARSRRSPARSAAPTTSSRASTEPRELAPSTATSRDEDELLPVE